MLSPRTAVTVAFTLDGAVYGSWAARVPALGERVGSGPGGLGLALLGPAVAMVLTASPAGWLCARLGARRTVVVSLGTAALVLPMIGLAESVWQLGLALAALGGLMGAVDVGVNVAAVSVVRALGRPLMPVFHGAFSFGGLIGAVGASTAAALDLPPWQQFCAVGACALMALAVCGGSVPGAAAPGRGRSTGSLREVATRPLLWLLACVALCAAVAEGACSEWSAVFLVDQRGVDQAAGAAGYSAFTLAVALTRLTGERAQRRFGTYRVLAAGGALAACGVLLVITVPSSGAGYAGFAVAGVGLAYCFPIALGLAGDAGAGTGRGTGAEPGEDRGGSRGAERCEDRGTHQGREAGSDAESGGGERELGFVTTVAYAGLLGGPPLIGSVAQAGTMTLAMGMIGLIAALIIPAAIAAAASARGGSRGGGGSGGAGRRGPEARGERERLLH
jgi:hypothetical protein